MAARSNTTRSSSRGLAPAEGRFPIPLGGKNELPLPSLTTASDTWSRKSTTRVCGLRKSRFYMLIGLLVGLVIVIVAVGVGVGVGKNTSKSSDAAAPVSSGASSASPSPTSTTVTTSLLSTTTATATASPTSSSNNPAATAGKLDCPAANGTEYQVPGSTKRFLRVCGVDYTGSTGGVDLKQVTTQSMLDCMTNCAGTYGCTGAGWGYMEGDSGYEHRCWLKSKLMKSHETDINWSFAVLL
ncbi:hypothetical protein PG996_003803 [Apiospora saccharicola]|uniref:Apple domain-containing protein n=1 Tax=Apiospora saccharicola TaxID=335842 RepID=A0ABR1W2E8_9PEZI